MNCLCTEARLILLEQQVVRINRRLQALLAQNGIDILDFTVLFSAGHIYHFTIARQDLPALIRLVHAANETALLLNCTNTVSIESRPFAASMASDGKDWRGLITYANWEKPLAFASRTDLQEMRQVLAETASNGHSSPNFLQIESERGER